MATLKEWQHFRDSSLWREWRAELEAIRTETQEDLNNPNATLTLDKVRGLQAALHELTRMVTWPDTEIDRLKNTKENDEDE